jgi:hypothetical protein
MKFREYFDADSSFIWGESQNKNAEFRLSKKKKKKTTAMMTDYTFGPKYDSRTVWPDWHHSSRGHAQASHHMIGSENSKEFTFGIWTNSESDDVDDDRLYVKAWP